MRAAATDGGLVDPGAGNAVGDSGHTSDAGPIVSDIVVGAGGTVGVAVADETIGDVDSAH